VSLSLGSIRGKHRANLFAIVDSDQERAKVQYGVRYTNTFAIFKSALLGGLQTPESSNSVNALPNFTNFSP
jgi:hypothetical protein